MYKLTKPFLFACLLGSVIVFTSCNEGEEGDNFVATEIVGTWNFHSFDFSGTINGKDFLEYMAEEFGYTQEEAATVEAEYSTEFNTYDGGTFTFNADGSFVISFPGEPIEEGTWSLNEGSQILLITIDNEAIEHPVKTLNGSSLVVEIEERLVFDINQDQVEDEMVFIITLGLSK